MATLKQSRGNYSGTVLGGPAAGSGVFGRFGESLVFGGAASEYIEFGSDLASAFGGKPFVTIEAWVQTDSLITDQTILVVTDGANAERLWCGLDATGKWECRARARNADTLRTVTSTGPTPSTLWHHVGFVVDIPGDRIDIYVDGAHEYGTTADFGANTWFNEDSSTENRIGVNAAASPGAGWDGEIASVGIHWRKMTEGEFSRVWRLGRRGVLT